MAARGGVGGGKGRGGGRDRGTLGFAGEECRLWPVGCWARWREKREEGALPLDPGGSDGARSMIRVTCL